MEVAGLALAIFPIVVGGLQFYAEKARTIKDMWRPEIVLSSLSRELKVEQWKFENTCRLLLANLMVSDSQLALLMENPGGALWSADDIQQKLKDCLQQAPAHLYMESMEALTLSLQRLQEELQFTNPKDDKLDMTNKKALRKNLKRIMAVLSKVEYKEQLANITKINSDLASLAEESKPVNHPPQMAASVYKRIRNHAINLYSVLKEKLQAAPACACTIPHNANLRLEMRNITDGKDNGRDICLRFHVVLSFENDFPAEIPPPWNWREIELEPLDSKHPSECGQAEEIDNSGDPNDKGSHPEKSRFVTVEEKTGLGDVTGFTKQASTPTETPRKGLLGILRRRERKSTTKVAFNLPQADCTSPAPITPDTIPTHTPEQIKDLCLAIQRANSDLTCFGVLIDTSDRRYRIWPPIKPSFTSKSTTVLSLESLLTQGVLKRIGRLILGVQLASSVMQLHATGWLDENWGKKDILFHQATIEGRYTSPVSIQPFVRRIFAPQRPRSLPPQAAQEPKKTIYVQHSQSLFSLGVILVELWHGRRLEDLRIEADGNGTSDATNFVTAWRLANELSGEAGERYGDAVRRCIVGLDHKPRDSSLEKDDFKNEVHMKVVSPLVDNLVSFSGMELGEILKMETSMFM